MARHTKLLVGRYTTLGTAVAHALSVAATVASLPIAVVLQPFAVDVATRRINTGTTRILCGAFHTAATSDVVPRMEDTVYSSLRTT